ncbi:MAG: class I SAM-dependent methyltransferase [Lentisphaerae bacterium]|nr:class I SAM-dependent methyltransferase [Lentisphaerota bacterium]
MCGREWAALAQRAFRALLMKPRRPPILRGMDATTLATYEREASRLTGRYETADMSATHRLLLKHLPAAASVLEIGSGSGRDAAFLLRQGFDVTATDASPAMVAEAKAKHPELDDRLLLTAVPLDPDSLLLTRRFSAVVAIAVVMHLSDEALGTTARQFRRLLTPTGLVFVSASVGRAGIAGQRDNTGRLFIERSPDELTGIFAEAGFERVELYQNSDAFDREVAWFSLVFRSSPAGVQ